jgi:hypothetical protein
MHNYNFFARGKGSGDGFGKVAILILHRMPAELNNDHDEYAEFS